MIDQKYLCNGEEIVNVRFEKLAFIKFYLHSGNYVLEGNDDGLKSFIYVLNKMINHQYNFVRLEDLAVNEGYIDNAQFFFDQHSNPLEICKIKKFNNIFYEECIFPDGIENITLYLSRNRLIYLKNEILDLIARNDTDEKVLSIYELSNQKKKYLYILNKKIQPIRSWDKCTPIV